eukprot:COSAG06_NODE_1320_length_9872_cov_49.877213_16_plen_175_part_00
MSVSFSPGRFFTESSSSSAYEKNGRVLSAFDFGGCFPLRLSRGCLDRPSFVMIGKLRKQGCFFRTAVALVARAAAAAAASSPDAAAEEAAEAAAAAFCLACFCFACFAAFALGASFRLRFERRPSTGSSSSSAAACNSEATRSLFEFLCSLHLLSRACLGKSAFCAQEPNMASR